MMALRPLTRHGRYLRAENRLRQRERVCIHKYEQAAEQQARAARLPQDG